jgi:hypothetical protein
MTPTRFLLAALAVAALPASAAAQRVPCSYDECALRVERNRILAGTAGREVGRFNLIGTVDLTALVAGDSATHYAVVFERKQVSGGVLSLVGGLLVLGGTIWAWADEGEPGAWTDRPGFWVSVGGSALGLAGSIQLNQARTALSRAIWWNNRDPSR